VAEKQAEKKGNQSEGEFFALVGTGRKGVEDALAKTWPEIASVAAVSIREAGDLWKSRAFLYVANNENLMEVIGSRKGIYSVVKCWEKAATMGVWFGGQFPMAHLVPFKDKGGTKQAELIITADGYKHTAKHGPQPVIRDLQYGVVRDGDSITIDQTEGKVHHVMDPLKPRGKVLGVWGIITQIDGREVACWMSYGDIIKIRDTHSIKWKYDKSGPWLDDEEMMCVKTAIKRFLRSYAAEAEGLAQMYAEGNDEYIPPEPPSREVSERVSKRMGEVVEADFTAGAPEPPAAETPAGTKEAPKSAAPEPAEAEREPGEDSEPPKELF
jgi:recombinational DNA repair protein RecT